MRCIGGAICAVLLWSSAALAQPIVDGVVDGTYGAAIATDKEGDGNGQAVMDLKQLYMWHDATDLYIALTIKGDITDTTTPNNWGKYLIYIDTTNNTAGASSDPWTRNVLAEDPHKPEFALATWVDQLPYNKNRVELWAWQNGSWAKVNGQINEAALAGPTTATPYSVIEMSVKIGALGGAQTIWVEGYSTSGTSSDNAQDTVNNPAEDFNATDWTTQSLIKVSTQYSLAPTPDAGTPDSTVDSGPAPDTTVDSGPAPDTTVSVDSGPAPDTTVSVDSGPAPDTTASVDSGPTPDTTVSVDSGPTPDTTASVDSAPPADSAPVVDSAPADVVGLDPHADEMGVLDGPVQVDTGGGTLDGTPPQGDSGTKPKQDEGCSCEVGRAPGSGLALLLLLGVALLGLRRRRG